MWLRLIQKVMENIWPRGGVTKTDLERLEGKQEGEKGLSTEVNREQRQGQDDRGRVCSWEGSERPDDVEGMTKNWPLEKDLEKSSRWPGDKRGGRDEFPPPGYPAGCLCPAPFPKLCFQLRTPQPLNVTC